MDLDIDRRIIDIPEVKELGSYEAVVNLHPEVDTRIKFDVVEDK